MHLSRQGGIAMNDRHDFQAHSSPVISPVNRADHGPPGPRNDHAEDANTDRCPSDKKSCVIRC